jgi:hypothetical protein
MLRHDELVAAFFEVGHTDGIDVVVQDLSKTTWPERCSGQQATCLDDPTLYPNDTLPQRSSCMPQILCTQATPCPLSITQGKNSTHPTPSHTPQPSPPPTCTTSLQTLTLKPLHDRFEKGKVVGGREGCSALPPTYQNTKTSFASVENHKANGCHVSGRCPVC